MLGNNWNITFINELIEQFVQLGWSMNVSLGYLTKAETTSLYDLSSVWVKHHILYQCWLYGLQNIVSCFLCRKQKGFFLNPRRPKVVPEDTFKQHFCEEKHFVESMTAPCSRQNFFFLRHFLFGLDCAAISFFCDKKDLKLRNSHLFVSRTKLCKNVHRQGIRYLKDNIKNTLFVIWSDPVELRLCSRVFGLFWCPICIFYDLQNVSDLSLQISKFVFRNFQSFIQLDP